MFELEELNQFIKESRNSVFAVANSIQLLEKNGFEKLEIENEWSLSYGKHYYVSPYPSMLIAFKLPTVFHPLKKFRIIASHTDQPGFVIKPKPEIRDGNYLKLNIEVYGSPIFSTWLDRVLSLSGRVVLKGATPFNPISKLVYLSKMPITIPNLSIHMNREINNGYKYNPQIDLLPLITTLDQELSEQNYLLQAIAEELKCEVDQILDFELYLSIEELPQLIGIEQNLFSAPRLDNLLMVYTSLKALIASTPEETVSMVVALDNEEIGSRTKQGADNQLVSLLIEKIGIALHADRQTLIRSLKHSFLISADAAHGLHPNHPQKADLTNQPRLNQGLVIKTAANQSYLSDVEGTSMLKHLMQNLNIPYQTFVNRSDLPGGKTLGPLMSSYLPIMGVDLGVPLLAMHSARELVGVKDIESIYQLFVGFYQ